MKFLPTPKPVVRTAVSSHDSIGRGIEIAAGVGVFFVVGLFLDNAFNTSPIFVLALSLFSLLGSFVRLWYVYDADMQTQEAKRRGAATSHLHRADLTSEK